MSDDVVLPTTTEFGQLTGIYFQVPKISLQSRCAQSPSGACSH
jgi:hypothetical protein